MADPYYTFYPGDYQRDTQDLSIIEHGIYRILLDYYYCNEHLPIQKPRLYTICRATTEEECTAIDTIIERFFTKKNDLFLRNKRADKEIKKRKKFLKEQKRKSVLALKARKDKTHG